jgi:radical SAM protein with 4Fe4S-binding SPASM domain
MTLKKKGLLLAVFTNAVLINSDHIRLFKDYPPRDVEVSVYGVTEETYERVTQTPGSFKAFMRGLNLLLSSGVKVRFKAMALRSNVHELPEISRFCRERTKDYFRFDPMLHLRFDADSSRNAHILAERLSPEKIVEIERADPKRFESMQQHCDSLIMPELEENDSNLLLRCGTGVKDCTIGYDGFLYLCSSLRHPECRYDLRKGTLADAWHQFVPRVRQIKSDSKEFMEKCGTCPLFNLCLWCPAHAYLETGKLDKYVEEFCKIAHARSKLLEGTKETKSKLKN